MFSAWDSRVLHKFVEHGLRETPTLLYPTATDPDDETKAEPVKDGSVTLTTSKHQEAWSYLRSNFSPRRSSNPNSDEQERLMSPDLDPSIQGARLFHRAEVVLSNIHLPQLRPRVLWIFGARSPINSQDLQKEKMTRTGIGVGGSGGVEVGKVEKVVVPKTAHLVMFERVDKSAAILADWLRKQSQTFREEEEFYSKSSSGKSEKNMLVMSDQWLRGVRQKRDAERPVREKL